MRQQWLGDVETERARAGGLQTRRAAEAFFMS